jgi:hypothetical protein
LANIQFDAIVITGARVLARLPAYLHYQHVAIFPLVSGDFVNPLSTKIRVLNFRSQQ